VSIKAIKRSLILFILFALVFSLFFRCSYSRFIKYDLSGELIKKSNEASVFALGEMTSFIWDIAYLDYDNYDRAKKVKEKHSLNGYINGYWDSGYLNNGMVRVIFVKNGWIVKYAIIDESEIMFYPSEGMSLEDSELMPIEILKPDTMLYAERKPHSYIQDLEILFLSLKE